MKFDVTQNVITQRRFGDFVQVQSKILNCFADGNPSFILAPEKFFIHAAHQRPASDKRNSKPHSLFLRKSNDLNRKRQLRSAQRFH